MLYDAVKRNPTKKTDSSKRSERASLLDFCGSRGKETSCNAGEQGSVPSREDPLEKEMATPSSILAWRITWTEEPGGLQRVHRVTKSQTQLIN